jgi:hypothetical protein
LELKEPDLLAVISLIFSLVALAISAGRLVRRPKISAFWKSDDPSGGLQQPMEYIEIVVTARQRGLDLREIGLLSLNGRPPLLRRWDEATLLADTHHRMALASKPATLLDGGSRSASIDLDSAIDEFHGYAGSEYAYVLASGTIYLKKTKTLTRHSGGRVALRHLPVCRWVLRR